MEAIWKPHPTKQAPQRPSHPTRVARFTCKCPHSTYVVHRLGMPRNEGVRGSSSRVGFNRLCRGFVSNWSRPQNRCHVHSASNSFTCSTDLVLGWDLNSVPVLDHSGVVLLDHRHARPALLGDSRERNARVDLKRDEAGPKVPGPRSLRRDPGYVGTLRRFAGRSSPRQMRDRQLRQSSGRQKPPSCDGKTGCLLDGRPQDRNHSRRSCSSGVSSGVNLIRCRLVSR